MIKFFINSMEMNEIKCCRNNKIDNLKGLLIFLVVLGHFMEYHIGENSYILLLFIYSFHMPVFVYLSGRLAKYNPPKIFKKLVLPYILMQTIAGCIYNFFYDAGFYIISPFHSLWYMISLFSWYLIIPLLNEIKHQKLGIVIFILLGLIIGYDATAGMAFSLSRTFVYLPYFLFGYYFSKNKWNIEFEQKNKKIIPLILVIIILISLYSFRKDFNVMWFYGSYSYEFLEYDWKIRLLNYVFGFTWILFFENFYIKKETILSKIGKNSLSVYLIHFILVFLIEEVIKLCIFPNHPTVNCIIYALIITFILSRNGVKRLFKF